MFIAGTECNAGTDRELMVVTRTALGPTVTIGAVQRIDTLDTLDTLASFPDCVLDIVCDALDADAGVYRGFGALGAQSFVYCVEDRGFLGATYSVQLPVRTEKPIEIVFTISRGTPVDADEQPFLDAIESHWPRHMRSCAVLIASPGRCPSSPVADAWPRPSSTRWGHLSSVDGSASIFARWCRDGSSLCAAVRAWSDEQLSSAPADCRPFVSPSVDVVLVASWRGACQAGALLEFEEQIFDGADLRCVGLTAREAEVLALFVVGSDANAIARRVGSRPGTVKKQIESIYRKLCVHTRRDDITIAVDAMMNPETSVCVADAGRR